MEFKVGDKVCCPRWGYDDSERPGIVARVNHRDPSLKPYAVDWPDGDRRWHDPSELYLVSVGDNAKETKVAEQVTIESAVTCGGWTLYVEHTADGPIVRLTDGIIIVTDSIPDLIEALQAVQQTIDASKA